ncbi:MAG: ATP-binding protein [Pseudomonadota bacterium]
MFTQATASILASMPLACVLIGQDARILSMNAPAEELLGANVVGRHHVTVLRQPALLEAIEQALHGDIPQKTRYNSLSEESDSVYRVTVSPVAGETGEAILVVFEDVTDVERAGEMRRDFVANVTHELKTPLTALLGFVETLRGAARDDAEARDRFLGIMEREGERMNRLINDLLSLSRVESSERRRPTERVRIDELIISTMSALRPLAEQVGVTLRHRIEGDGEDLTAPCDPDQLTQVFSNLIENAIKYGGTGEIVDIRITAQPREIAFRGPAVRVDVIDYGEGFDPLHIPRLTERFYRVDAHRSREKGGTGLGLAIAKHIVNRHRGRLRIESTPGEGSMFTVLLAAGA